MSPNRRVVVLAFLGWVLSAGFDGVRADSHADLSEARGAHVYARACVACHGIAGNGTGPAATYLDPRPRDFTRGTFKFRSTPSGEPPTDEDLIRTVEQGVPNTWMPAWKDILTEGEIRDVVGYVKGFSDAFSDDNPPAPIAISPEPEPTPATLDEGKSMYMIMQCWTCHGASGRGDGESAGRLTDDWGHDIRPYDFTRGNYKAGSDRRSVYKTFNTGLNGTPMPSYADAFFFGGEDIRNFETYEKAYSADEIRVLQDYLRTQPTMDAMLDMSEEEQERIVERRKWSLVHYVRSLSRGKGWFYRTFVQDTETTQ